MIQLNNVLIKLFSLLLFIILSSCKVHQTEIQLKTLLVSLDGGNAYSNCSNKGNITIITQQTDEQFSNDIKKFDVYSPLEFPVTLSIVKINDTLFILNKLGKKFALDTSPNNSDDCTYDCNIDLRNFGLMDKIDARFLWKP